jgi:class 3 adenylate cyclase
VTTGLAFVDRARELGLLQHALEDARSGSPRLVTIAGEAGLGKTALLDRFCEYADELGVLILRGTCHDEFDLAYLPLATALRPVFEWPTTDDGGSGDSWDAAFADRGRLRLLLAITDALAAAAAKAPTVLVIDDLQWADDATLDALQHLTTAVLHDSGRRGLRLLLGFAHRPVREGERAERFLVRVHRQGATLPLALGAFGVPEVRTMVRAHAGYPPDSPTLAALVAASGGNPLLLKWLVERNLTAGALVVDGDAITMRGRELVAVAHELDEEVRLRLASIGSDALETARLAAVVGNDGEVALVEAARAIGGDATAGTFAEAGLGGIVEVDGARYRFVRPELRAALLAGLDVDHRERLHGRVAAALEALHGDRAPPRTLAHHLLHARDVEPARLARWAAVAGDLAAETGAWSDAVAAYEAVLEVLDDVPAGTIEHDSIELELRAGAAGWHGNDLPATTSHLERAAACAREAGDVERWTEAELIRARVAFTSPGSVPGRRPDTQRLDELLERLRDPGLRARVLATQADLRFAALDFVGGTEAAESAIRLTPPSDQLRRAVQGYGDAVTRAHASLGFQQLATLDLASAAAHFDAVRAEDRDAYPHGRAFATTRLALLALLEGRASEAARHARDAEDLERRHGMWGELQVALTTRVCAATAAGDLDGIEELASEVIDLYEWLPYAFTPGLLFPALAFCRAMRGDAGGAHRSLEQWELGARRGAWRFHQLVDALCGDRQAAIEAVATRSWPAPAADLDVFTLSVIACQAEVGAALREPTLLEPVLEPLARAIDRGVVGVLGWPALLERVLGEGLAVMGDRDRANRMLVHALEVADAHRLRIERARCHLALAELLDDADPSAASRNAALAADELDELGVLALHARARRLIRGPERAASRPRVRVVMCTDLVGSTELNVQAGDAGYVDLLREHDRILRARLHRHRGVEFKHVGDGLLAWFETATDAVSCGLGIHDDIDTWNAIRPELPLRVRVGLAVGEPVDEGDDLFGLVVVMASRVCAISRGNQTVVAPDVVELVRGAPVSFRSLGTHALKGLPGEFLLHEVVSEE